MRQLEFCRKCGFYCWENERKLLICKKCYKKLKAQYGLLHGFKKEKYVSFKKYIEHSLIMDELTS